MSCGCDVEKVEVAAGRFVYYTFPKLAVLVTVATDDNAANIITLAWHTPLSFRPPLYGICIDPRRYSHELIEKSGEFVVNFAPFELLEKLHFCGRHSGRDVDKFARTALTPIPSRKVRPPRIKECYAHLECKLARTEKYGDHTMFVGEVLAVSADADAFDDVLREGVRPTYYLGANQYTTLGDLRRGFGK